MNILICCEFYSPSVGGVEKVAEQLAKNFKIYGHNVSIATSKYNKRLIKSEILDKIKIHRFQISGNFKKGLRGNVNEYQKFLTSNKYDVILFYAAQQWTLDAALPILDKIKTNIYLATCGFSGLKKIGYKNYFKILKKKLFYFNRNIVHSNNYIDTMFLKKNKIKNKTLIPNAAENIFNKKNNSNFFYLKRINEAKKNILNISNYKFNKGQDISILVFFLLKYKDKINLIFIGNKFNSKIYFYYIRILKFFTEFFFKNKKILFLEIPLLVESKLMKYFDVILLIKSNKILRLKRYKAKKGDIRLFNLLDKQQLNANKKIKYCNHVIINNKTLAVFKKKLLNIIKKYE